MKPAKLLHRKVVIHITSSITNTKRIMKSHKTSDLLASPWLVRQHGIITGQKVKSQRWKWAWIQGNGVPTMTVEI